MDLDKILGPYMGLTLEFCSPNKIAARAITTAFQRNGEPIAVFLPRRVLVAIVIQYRASVLLSRHHPLSRAMLVILKILRISNIYGYFEEVLSFASSEH